MNIVIADDQELVRDGLCELIRRDDPEGVVRPARSLDEALAILARTPEVELALLDLYMPGMQGVGGALLAAERHPGVQVVLMSGQAADADILKAMRGGVRGFIPKTLSGRALVAALRLILAGETYFPADLLLQARGGGAQLNERERQILVQLRQGATNKAIAQRLGLDEMTVKSTLRAVGVKLGARTRTEIALKSLELD